jgi:hypothetical protein
MGGFAKFSGVHAEPQFLPCLEDRNRLRIDRNRLAISRIATDARTALPDRKSTKTAEFDPISAHERGCYSVEDGRYDGVDVIAPKVRIGGRHFSDQFGFGQRASCHRFRERCQTDMVRSILTLCEIGAFSNDIADRRRCRWRVICRRPATSHRTADDSMMHTEAGGVPRELDVRR